MQTKQRKNPAMKTAAKLLATLLCALLAGCATQMTATNDFDPAVDFSQYRTFSWIDPNPLVRAVTKRPLSPLLVVPLQEQAAQALTARGLTFVGDPADADLVVAFTIGSREGLRINSFPTRSFQTGPRGRRGYAWGNYWSGSTVTTRRYKEGQLAVDLFDVAKARPVWHGTTSSRVTSRDLEAPQDLIRRAVDAIFAEFPPG